MRRHVTILGRLQIACGVLWIGAAVGILFLANVVRPMVQMVGELTAGATVSHVRHGMRTVWSDWAIVAVISLIFSVPMIAAGVGLIERKPWARSLAIATSVLLLLAGVPFIALGVYGLVILFSTETRALLASPPADAL